MGMGTTGMSQFPLDSTVNGSDDSGNENKSLRIRIKLWEWD